MCTDCAGGKFSETRGVYLHCFGVLNLALMGYCMRDVGDESSKVLNWYKTSSHGFPPLPVTCLYFPPSDMGVLLISVVISAPQAPPLARTALLERTPA